MLPSKVALNPRLVYCSISGYGRTGPYADWPGYDPIIQAEGGMMGITGLEEGPPYRVGVPIVDITAGMFAASVLAALRARDHTGEGQLVDISLLDTQVALLANVASNYLVGGRPDLKDASRFATNGACVSNRPALVEALNDIFAAHDADEWLADLREAGLPCGPINTVPDVFDHPQAQARDLALET